MSFEEVKGDVSPKVHDKSHKKRHKDKPLGHTQETLISGQSTSAPGQHAEKDYLKSAGVGTSGGYHGKPYIEVMEETPSFKGGISGMKTPDAPPLISSASLRRFSLGQGGGIPGLDSLGVDQNRLANAAREFKDAAWQRAMEVKDTGVQYAWKLGTTVQQRLLGGGTGVSKWEKYGRKKQQSVQLYEQAEQKLREARSVGNADRANALYLEANTLKHRALKKAISAQRLADRMKFKSDHQVEQFRRMTTPEESGKAAGGTMTAWELYGLTKHKARQLALRADELEREARNTPDRNRANELFGEATRLRRKALAKAEEAQAYADGIKRAADEKVEELRQWAMRNEAAQAPSAETRV